MLPAVLVAHFNHIAKKVTGVAPIAPAARPRALVYVWCAGVAMMGRFWRPWRDKAGSSLIEYAFLIAITIALIIIGVAVAGLWASGIWAYLRNILA
jgi:Flp pilus assembly pilin Flp